MLITNMIDQVVRICTLIWLSLCCLTTIAFFDEISRLNRDLYFGVSGENETVSLLPNFKDKRSTNQNTVNASLENIEKTFRKKADILSRLLKTHIDHLRNETDKVELVFLVDASGSVGLKNFHSELNFVKHLLSDFSVDRFATRVAVVTFGGKRNIKRTVDQISRTSENDNKCYLLNKQLNNISYTGGGTYTRGALLEALRILEKSRLDAKKAVFLITDGFSNGGDPRPAASLLKGAGATIFTFGIRTGNVNELYDIASIPGDTYSYFLDSFTEFEALVRRALHRDLKTGKYVPVKLPDNCNLLCRNISKVGTEQNCCDNFATCACGMVTGHYACICPTGYFGSGFRGSCHPCPNGTYASREISGDFTSMCISCPDANHVTIRVPATSVDHCVCASGFVTDGNKCEVITCPKLKVPENGYLVKASACSNVVHAACGIRCRIGFYLTGDSIRLCGKDGNWSGNEPKCLLKTCPALRIPTHGRMRCQNDEDQRLITEDTTTYPIDARCQFKCEIGYQLRGSKIRNCLPLSQWDGLKATCKAIKCEPLKQIMNGQIFPEYCSGPNKVTFATNCTVLCNEGFVLEGPRFRYCGGRAGVWTQRRTVNRCIDKIPPSITCPSDIITKNLPGKKYTYVNWTMPNVTDNVDKSPILWSKPYITFPWKVKIGVRTVVYVAQDSSGNKARCKFKIKVLDTEPPMIENCIDPPIFFTDNGVGINNVSWDEPGFHDNSKSPVQVEQNYFPGENTFPIGLTQVIYNAIDKYDNKASCILNVTIKDVCKEVPKVLNGYSKCPSSINETNECSISCEEGYGFATEESNLRVMEDILLLKCNENLSNWFEDNYFPDCSESILPKSASQEGSIILEGNATNVCDNQTTLRELSEYITADLRSTLLDICGNDIECNLITFDPECEIIPSPNTIYSDVIRKRREFNYDDTCTFKLFISNKMITNDVNKKSKRDAKVNDHRNKTKMRKKKEKIEIKFKFLGKIIEEYIENPREGILKLRQKIEALSRSGKLNLLNNKTNQEIAKLALNLHLVFKNFEELCDPGSVLKKHTCIKCPLGTFFNASTKRCQSCPLGEYEDTTGSVKCKYCPEHTSTKKIHSKSIRDCINLCRPGYYSRKKRYQNTRLAVEPCIMCDIGFYQPEYGQTHCLSCPFNTTTKNHGTNDVHDCLPSYKIETNICDIKSCLNGGQCTEEEDSFSCECPEYYIGSKCETFRNPCGSSPCINEGTCNVQSFINNTVLYTCTCKNGYSGSNCEQYIDECTINPCQNNGTCMSTENDYVCECKNGFEGEFCEIAVDRCHPSPCMEGSTCQNIDGTWQCFCKPGFLGRYCNLLPCDWLPCNENSYCINIEEENATKLSYRCECINGYTGENCSIKQDHCESHPCLNNGNCVNNIFNYTCICPILFTGRHCETGKYKLSSDYTIHFTKSGTTDYISMKGPTTNLSKLSTCLWLQSKDTFNYGTVLSYATRYYDNAFTLTDYNGLVIYLNGEKIITDIKVNDGHWHFVCFTWEAENGSWNIFIDGLLRDNGTQLAKGTSIQGNGTLIIGQEQDRVGGGFSESESFLGKLTLLDVWSTILVAKDVKHLFNTCQKYHGDVIAWSQIQEYVHGDVAILSTSFCRGCPLPVIPFKGNINISEDASNITYYCDDGYVVRFRNKEYRSLKVKCLKHGQWEGYYTPICTRRKCGFPGYFPRGRIHGRSYLYGDEVHYFCLTGYELRGNPRRICNADGKWNGLPPVCIGKTCKNLLAPEHGDIEYVLEEYERDDLSILQVGQQIEFKCDVGFRLIGEKFLTCLESGLWDHERPTCITYGCSAPKEIKNGYIVSVSSNNLQGTFSTKFNLQTINNTFEKNYEFNDIIGYSCYPGYKFQSNHNLLSQFKLQCSENGTWIGFVPDCIPFKCPWPNIINNGKLLFKTQNNYTIELTKIKTTSNYTNTEITSEESDDDAKEEQNLEDEFTIGAQILVQCDIGYKVIGDSVRICTENGQWSSTLSSCELQECPILNHPFFHVLNEKTNPNSTKTIFYKTNSTMWKDDQNKKLDSKIPFNGTYKNLEYFVEGYTYMGKIILKCISTGEIKLNNTGNHNSTSDLTWFCNEHGKWEIVDTQLNNTIVDLLFNNDLDNICQEFMCSIITVPDYSYIVEKNYSRTVNSTITFKCHQGYILEGNERSVCFPNNTWSTIPSCKPIICGKPPKIANALLKGDQTETVNFTFGSTVAYECMPGYLMLGQPNTRCLTNGKWSRIYSRCSKLSCNKPKLPFGVTIRGRSYLYKDQLTYVCPDGKKQGLITCKADGYWSDPPNCNDN
ncbi:PREDICTED: sushi, von Willebrand factor type A, EGF and pentraxin domain-containing protein 1-like [Eufriesea mexicana]|uniref:sushi, von Willebrand factor type A, EGF and pentraxin domain-containing protein 1-like n=1 Tax=Eufriesea mexicana TaxID=516756 RepID=UPI00083BF823|nr:PREDICTED: sushi, von Willebrand factor type A, EGF and pentraxin domain-containing protein 1-like [Eufriesea mexicana]